MRIRQQSNTLFYIEEPKSINAEAFQTIRTNIQFAPLEQIEPLTLLVTSATPGEGKTLVSSNLATTLAQARKKVLIIDADLRRPKIHSTFPVFNNYGLSHILTRDIDIGKAIQRVRDIGVYVLTAGRIPPNPTELLGSMAMRKLMGELKERYDVIIIDSPPVLPVPDTLELVKHVTDTLMVIRSKKVLKKHAVKAKKLLVHAGANIIGTVLNDKKVKRSEIFSYYY